MKMFCISSSDSVMLMQLYSIEQYKLENSWKLRSNWIGKYTMVKFSEIVYYIKYITSI